MNNFKIEFITNLPQLVTLSLSVAISFVSFPFLLSLQSSLLSLPKIVTHSNTIKTTYVNTSSKYPFISCSTASLLFYCSTILPVSLLNPFQNEFLLPFTFRFIFLPNCSFTSFLLLHITFSPYLFFFINGVGGVWV